MPQNYQLEKTTNNNKRNFATIFLLVATIATSPNNVVLNVNRFIIITLTRFGIFSTTTDTSCDPDFVVRKQRQIHRVLTLPLTVKNSSKSFFRLIMADAAAFFANKKKKKKAFKFNANKIDAATVTSTVHVYVPFMAPQNFLGVVFASCEQLVLLFMYVSRSCIRFLHFRPYSDAPALSTDAEGSSGAVAVPMNSATNNDGDNDAQWDDEALAAATLRKGTAVAAPTNVTSKDWAEMKALDLKTSGNETTDIAEKLRVEETRAQLAAAREGMEREAQRLKEEKERKELEAKEKAAGRFGAAAAGAPSATGGKWVSSRMRESGLSGSGRFGNVGGGSQKLDTEDENLFPDLATADVIMKQKQEEQQKAAKKPTGAAAVGGGASWGSRPKLNLKPKSQLAKDEKEHENVEEKLQSTETESKSAEEAPKEEEEKAPEETTPAATEETTREAVPATTTAPAAVAAAAPIKPTKKKKKDIATFGKK
jgi:hypothetical protein